MTQADLAERSGIKLNVISSYESGRRVPRKGNYPKLADALGISLHGLFGIKEGEETIRELRLLAVKDQDDVAELLFGSVPGASVTAVVTWLGQIERGKEVPYWNDPVVLRNLLLILSDAYRVTQEEIREAWLRACPNPVRIMRDFPEFQNASDEGVSGSAVKENSAALRAWGDLNERQRSYLVVLYRADQDMEAEMRARSAATWKRPVPASEWRRMPFTINADPAFTGYTKIQEALRAKDELDPGAGSTLSALERRRLIKISEDQVEVFPLGLVPRTLVTLTRRGRACARAGVGEKSARRPSHLLSEWLWSNLVRVAAAGEEGLPVGDLWGKAKFYIGTGYQPTKKEGVYSRGYIDIVDIWEGEGPDAYVVDRRWKLTDAGLAHIAEHLTVYRNLYLEVDTTGICDRIG